MIIKGLPIYLCPDIVQKTMCINCAILGDKLGYIWVYCANHVKNLSHSGRIRRIAPDNAKVLGTMYPNEIQAWHDQDRNDVIRRAYLDILQNSRGII